MPVQQRGQVKQALGLYDKSNAEVRTLKSRLSESDVTPTGIVEEVLSRVKAKAMRNASPVDLPSREKVERLCYALISDDGQEGHRFIRAIALQKPWMRVLRNSLLQPAFLNFPRFDPFAELALIMFKAMRLKAAKLAGA